MFKTLYVTTRDQWRAWLADHHAIETEIWLLYYKKNSSKPRIPYDHAVEEALCFGWIDSIIRRIDDESFAQKFTPRRDLTKWSPSNKQRMRTLIRNSRMTQAGLAKIDPKLLNEKPRPKQTNKNDNTSLPQFMKQALLANPKAWHFFNTLAPSYRKLFIRWIMSAKKEETRHRRLKEAISLLQENKKLGLK